MQLTNREVQWFEKDLLGIEAQLEALGRRICDANGSANAWNAVNEAVNKVQDAIHESFRMYPPIEKKQA